MLQTVTLRGVLEEEGCRKEEKRSEGAGEPICMPAELAHGRRLSAHVSFVSRRRLQNFGRR
jgi:hypothetical protein